MKNLKNLWSKAKSNISNDFLLPKDKKTIEYLAAKKAEYIEAIEDIDQKIILIQNSTKTLIPLLAPWHHFLRQKLKWYYLWHLKPFAKFVHWFILFVYIIVVSGYLFKANLSSKALIATASYDFPRWEWSNPKPTGNNLNSITVCSLDGSYWVVGDAGTILKSTDGSTWTQQYSGVSSNLNDVLCLAPNNIIAIGANGTIVRYNGISWTQITSPVAVSLYEIIAFDSNNIIAVGDSGKIIKSSNAGQTWAEKSSGVSNALVGVAAFDSNSAVAVGSGGVITVTSDKGETWSPKSSGTNSYLSDVAVFNSTRAVAIGYRGEILLSTDKGQTWSEKYSGDYYLEAIAVSDASHATVVSRGGRIIVSSDAGNTWTVKYSSANLSFKAVAALDASHFVAVGSNHSYSGNIFVSSDAGANWAQIASEMNAFALNAIASVGLNSVVVVGKAGKIAFSSNAGQTWTEKSSGYSASFNKIAVLDSSHAVAIGWGGGDSNILVTSDGGKTWIKKGFSSDNFLTVAAFNKDNIVALGADRIAVSHNAGASWTALDPPVEAGYSKVVALDSTHAIAVGGNGTIIISSNTGNSWTFVDSGVDSLLSDVAALSATRAIAVGDDGTILLTTDGGETWTQISSGTTQYLVAVAAFDANRAVAVGYGGTILLTTDGGETWTQISSGTTQYLGSVAVFDTNRAIAVGGGGTILLTTDGGETWTQKSSGTAGGLTAVAARDSLHLAAVGYNGDIVSSNDGGNSWSAVKLTSNTLFDIQPVDSNQFFAVGMSGTILHYYSPQTASATKLLVKLPGQSFADGVGIFGSPDTLRAGENVSVTIYAVDNNNNLDRTNASWVGFTTTDPADTHPPQIQLTQGGTCVQFNRQPGDPECGIGTTTFNFHTPGTWTITASAVYGGLASGTSSSFNVIPGYPSYLSFSNVPSSLAAGSVSGAITLFVKDIYGNNTTVENDTTIRLSTTSPRGRFSQSPYGPWSAGQLDITIKAGSGTLTFYYLDLNTGNPTITASEVPASGWQDAQSVIAVTTGQLSQSTLSVDKNVVSAGESVRATVALKNSQGIILPNKTVSLISSRSDSISPSTQTTDANGYATFIIKPTLVGVFTLTAYDVTDNLYVTDEESVQVVPGALAKINLRSDVSSSVAGAPVTIFVTLYDAYDNVATNFNGKLIFSSSDKQAVFEESQHAFSATDKGEYHQKVVFKTAGTQSVIISSQDGKVTSSITLAISPAAVSPSVSTITSDKDKIKPKEETAKITVRLLDAYGNGIEGKLVELFSTRKEDNINPKTTVTDSSGAAIFTFSSDAEGESILQAADRTDSLILEDRLKITVAQPSLIDIIKQSPLIKKVTKSLTPIATTLATLGLIPLILQAVPSSLHLFTGIFPMLFTAAIIRRKRRSWGMVFDSLTGKAIDFAIVRLFDADTDKLVQTKVTDINGRFSFLVGKGRYYIKVTKPGYIFPSLVPKIKATQITTRLGPEADVYLGQIFNIENNETNINLNIPLDPVLHSLPTKLRIARWFKSAFDWFLISFSYASLPLMLFGASIAVLATIVSVSSFNLFIDGFYVLLLIGYLSTRKIQKARLGFVFDAETKEPISKAVISIFDKEYKALREVRLSDSHGHFSVLLPKGQYYLTVRAEGYKFPSKILKGDEFYHGEVIKNPRPNFLNVNIPMDKD